MQDNPNSILGVELEFAHKASAEEYFHMQMKHFYISPTIIPKKVHTPPIKGGFFSLWTPIPTPLENPILPS